MIAFRSLTRSASRVISHIPARSVKQSQPFRIQALLPAVQLSSPAARFVAPFSSTVSKLQDDALVVKLTQEINVEKDLIGSSTSKSAEQQESIDSYLAQSGFSLHDSPGSEEVVLSKNQDGETIRISFSTADINSEPYPSEAQYEDDAAQEEGAESGIKRDDNTANEAELENFPVKLNITITKSGKPGALCIEALTQYGGIMIDDFWYFADANLPQADTFELQNKRANIYAGPPFGNLDEDLQGLIDQYLADRGVNEALVEFVTEYVDYKEQKEYVQWLENVKGFFE